MAILSCAVTRTVNSPALLRLRRWPDVVDVPLALAILGETVPRVESIRGALLQSAEKDGQPRRIRMRRELGEHDGANSLRLMPRRNVKVLEVKAVWRRPERVEANPFAI